MNERGLRNFNPCNLELRPGVTWKGQRAVQTDPRFVQFLTVPYGYRATAIILDNYQRLHGLYTIDGMIRRWSETDQDAYVANISRACGMKPLEHFVLRAGLHTRVMLRAMTVQENGDCPYADTVIDEGISLAWGDRPATEPAE